MHREIYSMRAIVRSGNSGGPLITPDGHGATASCSPPRSTRSDTGFALTDTEIVRGRCGGPRGDGAGRHRALHAERLVQLGPADELAADQLGYLVVREVPDAVELRHS